ncbi:MAG: hypothetical protein AB8G05_10200 [Oligoflexales bacterium]
MKNILLTILLFMNTLAFAENQLPEKDKKYLRTKFIQVYTKFKNVYTKKYPDFEQLSNGKSYSILQIQLGGRRFNYIGNKLMNQFLTNTSVFFLNKKLEDSPLIAKCIYDLLQEFNIGVQRLDNIDEQWLEISEEDSIKFINKKIRSFKFTTKTL